VKRVLFLTKFVPEGKPYGGMIRTTQLLEALRSRFEVEVLGFSESGEPRPCSRLRSLGRSLATGRPYQTVRYDTRWLRREIDERLETFQPDVIHVDYLHQAPIVWDRTIPLALDLHNVESALSAGIGASSKGFAGWLARRDARLLEAVERRVTERYGLITVPSGKEATRMPGNVHVVVNGVHDRQPLDLLPDPNVVCFVGIFSWLPNIDGAEWLIEHVLPLLPERFRIQLVGRNPHRRVKDLAGPRVEVTGEVPDTWPYVCGAGVVAAPLLAPGGTRHKILEGALAGRPVVATRAAADGLEDLAGQGIHLVDDPQGFADAIVALAGAPDVAAASGRMGREAVLRHYAWSASKQKLLDLYASELGIA